MEKLIALAREKRASDIHLSFGARPLARIDGQLMPLEEYPPLTDAD